MNATLASLRENAQFKQAIAKRKQAREWEKLKKILAAATTVSIIPVLMALVEMV